MHADCAISIGSRHDLCQDYAVTGVQGPYAILADGCSSSPDTDVGARLLVKCLQKSLAAATCLDEPTLEYLHVAAVECASEHAAALGLDPRALDATLLAVRVCGDRYYATCYGDGVVAIRNRADVVTINEITFPNGYPRYASYMVDPERARAFEEQGGRKLVTTYRVSAEDGSVLWKETEESDRPLEVFSGHARDCELLCLASDGVLSVTEPVATETSLVREPVGVVRCMLELLSFKTARGAFARRRMRRFLADCERVGWRLGDDLSVAVLHA